jgi:phosphate transport system permease protein
MTATGVSAGSNPTALGRTQPDLGMAHKSRAREARNLLARVVMWLAFLIALIPLAWILWTVVTRGVGLVVNPVWWTNSQRGITSRMIGGGAAHAIQGTLLMALVTAIMAVPIGVMTAIYLVEYGRGRFAKTVSFMVDILTGIPSIVAALFIYAVWVTTFGFQRVGFAVSLALVMLMIPVIVRSTEEMLKLVPNELREASYALGVPKWKTIVKVVLPTAFSGIVTGILLGLARIMGETAPLLILGPYTANLATNLFGGFMATLPTMINTNRVESLQPAIDRTWATALTLIIVIMLLNLAGRLVARTSKVRN